MQLSQFPKKRYNTIKSVFYDILTVAIGMMQSRIHFIKKDPIFSIQFTTIEILNKISTGQSFLSKALSALET